MAAISLRHIDIFHAVMTTGNLTEAAALLNTSQPTVSRELARFEHLLQMTLFERVKGRLKPTGEGLRLFEEVQRSYYGLDRILSAARAIREFHQAQLSVACLPVFSQSLLPQVCRDFFTRHPAVSLSVVPQESPLLEEWLSAQRHDIGLTENTFTPAGTERETLMTLNEVCVLPAGHPLAQRAQLTPQDFHRQPYISLSATDSYRQLLDRLFSQAGVERGMVVETHSAASVCAMVRAGVGISIVNPLTALDYAASGVVLKTFSLPVPFTVSLIRPLHRPASALVSHFIDYLHAFAAAVPARLDAALAQP
ncbi:LysR family transcriptional regulator [Acerihabitans arboris]|uniref:LysR family transcriptional regulator n=1 Tax=Acerihabitans arboris TaxID=2691583 RepID=A0A845SS48_9GAMM|nr:LysR family transcriptional regulator [Acerihabitans arboris]NDL65498.1 LysR family transcriptional regulator [Acerihabitans arboris]